MKVYIVRNVADNYVYKICGDRLCAQECVLDIAYETAIACMESNLDEFYNEMDFFEKGNDVYYAKWRNHFSSYFSFFLYSVSTEVEIEEYEVEF